MLQVRNTDRKHEGKKWQDVSELGMFLLAITFRMLHSWKLGTISDQNEKILVK